MSIPLSCPSCGAQLHAKERHVGRTLKCPNCEHSIAVPPSASSADRIEGNRTCRECGAPVSANNNPFCEQCGAAVQVPETPSGNGTPFPEPQPGRNAPEAGIHPAAGFVVNPPLRATGRSAPRPAAPTPKIPCLSDGESIVRGYHFATSKALFRFVPLGWCHITLTNKRVIFNSLTYQWFQRNERYVEIPMDSVGCVHSDFLRGFPLLRIVLALLAALPLFVYAARSHPVPYTAQVPVEITREVETVYDRDAQLVHKVVVRETVRDRSGNIRRQKEYPDSGGYPPQRRRQEGERIAKDTETQQGLEPEARKRWGYGMGLLFAAIPLLYAAWMVFFSKRQDLVIRISSTKAMTHPIDVDGPAHTAYRIVTTFGLYPLFAGFASPMKYRIYDITPTPETWKMLQEIGAIILDVQTQGDRGAEKWIQRP